MYTARGHVLMKIWNSLILTMSVVRCNEIIAMKSFMFGWRQSRNKCLSVLSVFHRSDSYVQQRYGVSYSLLWVSFVVAKLSFVISAPSSSPENYQLVVFLPHFKAIWEKFDFCLPIWNVSMKVENRNGKPWRDSVRSVSLLLRISDHPFLVFSWILFGFGAKSPVISWSKQMYGQGRNRVMSNALSSSTLLALRKVLWRMWKCDEECESRFALEGGVRVPGTY
jgi:hypothetical protein